jgi:hypothetical protein
MAPAESRSARRSQSRIELEGPEQARPAAGLERSRGCGGGELEPAGAGTRAGSRSACWWDSSRRGPAKRPPAVDDAAAQPVVRCSWRWPRRRRRGRAPGGAQLRFRPSPAIGPGSRCARSQVLRQPAPAGSWNPVAPRALKVKGPGVKTGRPRRKAVPKPRLEWRRCRPPLVRRPPDEGLSEGCGGLRGEAEVGVEDRSLVEGRSRGRPSASAAPARRGPKEDGEM